jgi:hypothetical protein
MIHVFGLKFLICNFLFVKHLSFFITFNYESKECIVYENKKSIELSFILIIFTGAILMNRDTYNRIQR